MLSIISQIITNPGGLWLALVFRKTAGRHSNLDTGSSAILRPPRYQPKKVTLGGPQRDMRMHLRYIFGVRDGPTIVSKACGSTGDVHAEHLGQGDHGEFVDEARQAISDDSGDDAYLPLNSMYDGTGRWSKRTKKGEKHIKGAAQRSFTDIGFPHDRSLVVNDFENNAHNDSDECSVIQFSQDIIDIKTRRAGEIADDGAVQTHAEHGRTIEIFGVRGGAVAKATFKDADVYGKRGKACGDLPISGELERRITREVGDKPALGVEQWATAEILPASPGRSVEEARTTGRKHRVWPGGSYIFVALDGAGAVVAFVFSDTFCALLSKGVEKEVVRSLETYSTPQLVPVPDMTRHGFHWVDWLVQRPDFDFRNPQNDPRLAKSGVYHFGDPDGRVGPGPSQDLLLRGEDNPKYVFQQLFKLRHCALGACTELVRFFLNLLDPDLLAKYVEVSEEWDRGAWHRGLAGLVPVGEFEAGDLVMHELGLWVESRAGCVQLLRGRELWHSTTRWTGRRRFVVAGATHEAVSSCLDAKLEDTLSEDSEDGDQRVCIPERHLEESDSEEASGGSRGADEARRPPLLL
ncbi:hypothetical protein DL766_009131 [Monosporascus sp. MC13-8B]|uniref:Fungal-type protein kinase domain-containing protein n=1 Tax=Monosporascus cannonballus TaxID=155416 RepID=A0ABY0HGX6_9PEZI|nr:hypothetical protein DL762_001382 [Monosporascus cannonballus]RYP01005.1 hypothetical protein DL763_000426 [Monosporascus cannonballus]RYP16415.1 hypothetical protein DL766_009131 [Monosporascus sp. MC13-8B]